MDAPCLSRSATRISQRIRAYHGELVQHEHHRYRSWEHCYRFFRSIVPSELHAHRDAAALQLGFYLASWGMYRGSSFLLQHAYTAHLGIIDSLASPRFSRLWEIDVGSAEQASAIVPTVLSAADAVRDAYAQFGQPTDTLVTKVLLGTLGCLPACDRYFISGFKSERNAYSYLNVAFVERLLLFCRTNTSELRSEQQRIKSSSGLDYPFMKLVDMYFWQLGYEIGASNGASEKAGE